MQTPELRRPFSQTDAVVRRVDVVNRELTVRAGHALAVFDVPPGCAVLLRGERVKLRMVQPGDRVRVTYAPRRGSLVACAVEVQPPSGPR
jgi:hypothetical protein